ncbi:hypothetical protein BH11ARM2_BH11ARM2_38070 [soil metagenome]
MGVPEGLEEEFDDLLDSGYVRSDSTEVLQRLLHSGAFLQAEDRRKATPFLLASQHGRASRVRWLLAQETDVALRKKRLRRGLTLAKGRKGDDDQKAGIIAILVQ